jgi:hypothetical protein
MVTDPPYGVEYDPEWRNQRGISNSARTGKVHNDERADWAEAWALFPGSIAYVWHGALRSIPVAQSLVLWLHDQVADRVSDPVALPGHRQPAGRNHDADCVRVRIHACEPKPNFCTRTSWTRPVQWL